MFTCLQIAVKTGIFEKLKEKDAMTAQELSEATGIDACVIGSNTL